MDWRSCNGFVVVSVVHEDCSEVANDIDHEEDGAFSRLHGQVAATSISRDGMAFSSFNESIIYSSRTSEGSASCVRREGEDQNDDEQNHRVDVIGQELRVRTLEDICVEMTASEDIQ